MEDSDIEKVQRAIFECIEKITPPVKDVLGGDFIVSTIYHAMASLVLRLDINDIKNSIKEIENGRTKN